MDPLTIGVDLGQKHDPTAIAVVQRQRRGDVDDRQEPHAVVKYLARLPLGTSYPAVRRRLAEVIANAKRAAQDDAHTAWMDAGSWGEPPRGTPAVAVYVDATGLGQPVIDELAEAGVRVTGCYFTHGDRRTQEGGRVTIGKAWLVSRLQVVLQNGRLHLPDIPEARALEEELINYEIKVDQDANDKYGAFKTGTHDDLVTALGLAIQDGGPLVVTESDRTAVRMLYAHWTGR